MVNLAPTMRVLITGGAGFVGANLAHLARRAPSRLGDHRLRQPLPARLGAQPAAAGARPGSSFVHGDVREPDDLTAVEPVDALIECSAEPSVMAGADGETAYLVHTNLIGAYNCLELARRDGAQLVFLSTSRVYPVRAAGRARPRGGADPLRARRRAGGPGRLAGGHLRGLPARRAPARLYGATKLAAELLIEEYADGLRAARR